MALDLFVVLIYAAGMLVLGYYGMRRAKTHEDYLVAGRNLGPTLYMGTMAATVLGGASTVGTVRLGYVHGISGFWLCAALGAGIIALNLFLAKPLLKLKIFTVTQVLEKRYNPMARQASAVIMLAYALMIGVTSILAIGTVLQVLFDLPFWISVLVGGGVVTDLDRHRAVRDQDRRPDVYPAADLPVPRRRLGRTGGQAARVEFQLHRNRLGHHHHLLHDLLLRHPDRPGHLATGVHCS